MKTSSLIQSLQNILKDEGDLDIYIEGSHFEFREVCSAISISASYLEPFRRRPVEGQTFEKISLIVTKRLNNG